MRPGIAITLIVCGTLLLLSPAIYNFSLAAQVTDVLVKRTDLTSVHGGEPMAMIYKLVCWLAGVAMVGVSVLCSIRLPAPENRALPSVA